MVRGRTGSCVSLLLTHVCGWQRAFSSTKSVSAALFFFFFLQVWKPLFNSTRHYHAVTPPTRRSAAQKWPTSFLLFFFIFPPHLHRPSAHTSRGAINPFQLWPLDMLTVDDLCWCRCYVKSAPLRPHCAGAHLDCTQAGKMHREALLSPHWQLCWVAFCCLNLQIWK